MKTAAEVEVDGAVTMNTNKCVEIQIHLSEAGTEAGTGSTANMD
jgi:hypothetical protein